MRKEQIEMEKEPAWTMKKLLRAKRLRQALIIVCGLQICQQLSGISGVSAFALFFSVKTRTRKKTTDTTTTTKTKVKTKNTCIHILYVIKYANNF